MNNSELLTEQLLAHPDDDTLAAALLDELQDVTDAPLWCAEVHVELIRAQARAAAELAEATNLMRAGTRSGRWLRIRILDDLGIPRRTDAPIYVRFGSEAPTWTVPTSDVDHYFLDGVAILVGAKWVLARWSEERERVADRNRRARWRRWRWPKK